MLGGEGVRLYVVYEAGPMGCVVYRRLKQLELDCIVVAPPKIPKPKGARQKTDRRDAVQLARLHRAGELTAIHVPDEVDESVRDLTRAQAPKPHHCPVTRVIATGPLQLSACVGPIAA